MDAGLVFWEFSELNCKSWIIKFVAMLSTQWTLFNVNKLFSIKWS